MIKSVFAVKGVLFKCSSLCLPMTYKSAQNVNSCGEETFHGTLFWRWWIAWVFPISFAHRKTQMIFLWKEYLKNSFLLMLVWEWSLPKLYFVALLYTQMYSQSTGELSHVCILCSRILEHTVQVIKCSVSQLSLSVTAFPQRWQLNMIPG